MPKAKSTDQVSATAADAAQDAPAAVVSIDPAVPGADQSVTLDIAATDAGQYISPRCRITAKRPNFWRGGHVHTSNPTPYEPGAFTESQFRAIREEPMLIVELDD